MPRRTPSTQIVIIGAGKIGQAIAHFLQTHPTGPVTIHFWDKDPSKVPEQKPYTDLLPSADFVFFCVPSWVLREALTTCKPCMNEKAIILTVSKGIEESTHKTVDQLLAEIYPHHHWALLLGPMLAEEILRGLPASAAVATKEPRTYREVSRIFKGSMLKLEQVSYPHHAAVASVLKNVYSLAMGLTDGLGWGNNQKGAFAAQAIKEMHAVMKALRSDASILNCPAGIPDFLATAFSPTSRNRILGEEIIKNGHCTFKSEGYVALPSLIRLLGSKTRPFPILHALRRVLLKGEHAEIAAIFQQL